VIEIRNQTVKDQPFFLLRYTAEPPPAFSDDSSRNGPQGKNIQHLLNPLLRGKRNLAGGRVASNENQPNFFAEERK
jgi:hypothetical protein